MLKLFQAVTYLDTLPQTDYKRSQHVVSRFSISQFSQGSISVRLRIFTLEGDRAGNEWVLDPNTHLKFDIVTIPEWRRQSLR